MACVPSFIAGPRILKSHLRPLLTEYEDAPIGVYCLYPPARHLALKVRALVDAASKRKIATIAERVEDANTMAVLWQLGVQYIQGYFVNAPEDVHI